MPNFLGAGLERISGLTPGDFKVVYQKNVFNEKKPSSELLKELENEVSYTNAFGKKGGCKPVWELYKGNLQVFFGFGLNFQDCLI